jgi:hypothetical protein
MHMPADISVVAIICRSGKATDGPLSQSLLLRCNVSSLAASCATSSIRERLVIGGIHKMSTLVQWARVEVIDVDANRVVFDRLFTFRGDNSQAWDRAEAFVFREVQEGLAARGG